jgi:hypothetical protein
MELPPEHAPEHASVEAFVQHCMDEERDSYAASDAIAISAATRTMARAVHAELQSYGLRREERAIPRRVRGHLSSSHDRWFGPGSSKTAGGSGWMVISGFAGTPESTGWE